VPDWYRRVGTVSWFFLGIVAALALLAYLISATSEITIPLILGAFFAVVFLPAVKWLADHHIPRSLAAGLVLIGLVLLFTLVGWVTVAALVDQSDELSDNLSRAITDIRSWLDDTPIDENMADQIRDAAEEAGPTIAQGVSGSAVSLLDSAVGFAAGLILGTIVLYYLLKDLPTLGANFLAKRESSEEREILQRIGERMVFNVQNYFKGRTAMALMNGLTIGAAALVLGVPAAGAIAVVNVIGAYIPYLGAFIGGAFAVLMGLGEGGIGLALAMLGISLGVNLLLENLLEPRLLGDSLDMHPLLVLLATSLGGMLAGMVGLILAAPLTAIVIDLQRELKDAGFYDDD
jgi:predicted PurR-regulated permease PerM